MAIRDDISLLLYQAGFGNQYVTMANKSKAIQCILFHQVFKARSDQIVVLMDGLNTLGILEPLRANNACLSLVFPLHSEVSISESDVLAKVEYLQDQSEREKEVALWFAQYVKYLAGSNADSPGFFLIVPNNVICILKGFFQHLSYKHVVDCLSGQITTTGVWSIVFSL